MRIKAIYVVLSVCLSIIWKLSLVNFIYFVSQDNSLKELVTTNNIFKVGKKRRRSDLLTAGAENKSHDTEESYAEKAETESEDNNNLFKKIKLSFTTFFWGFILNITASIKTGARVFPDDCINVLSSKRYLSISILRI